MVSKRPETLGIALVIGSSATVEDALEGARKMAKNTNGASVQLFDPDSIAGENHLKLALKLAEDAFAKKQNYARTLETEMLLKAAGTRKIDEALGRVGAKSPKRFLLVVLGGKADSLAKKLGKTEKWKGGNAGKLAQLFGIGKRELELYPLEELVLERIALAALSRQ
ncbi:MAG: KEOPS complex subunit Cgi121 [Candidatus Micrarchaeota archaeon]|nr:KEOPS complex subunit Cgi121 [Candidatus Micrarchaeota archaeon]